MDILTTLDITAAAQWLLLAAIMIAAFLKVDGHDRLAAQIAVLYITGALRFVFKDVVGDWWIVGALTRVAVIIAPLPIFWEIMSDTVKDRLRKWLDDQQ